MTLAWFETRPAAPLPFVSKHARVVAILSADAGRMDLAYGAGATVNFARVRGAERCPVPGFPPSLTMEGEIVHVSCEPSSTAEEALAAGLLVATTAGLFRVTAAADPAAKKPRTEDEAGHASLAVHRISAEAAATAASLFLGVTPLQDGALAVADEVRRSAVLFDADTGDVLHRAGCVAMPTAIAPVRGVAGGRGFLTAEGRCVALWDPRVAGTGACVSRLTAQSSQHDCVHGHSALPAMPQWSVATGSSDRSLTIFDLRKWSRQATARNTLKFDVNSVACVAHNGGSGRDAAHGLFVVGGIDAEVRLVNTAAKDRPEDAPTDPLLSAFRQRLATSRKCRDAWHGAVVAAPGSSCAVAVSTVGEVFALLDSAADPDE